MLVVFILLSSAAYLVVVASAVDPMPHSARSGAFQHVLRNRSRLLRKD